MSARCKARPPAGRRVDALWRVTFWLGYRVARLVWRIVHPRACGALVAVWCDGQVLAVRTSYRPGWDLPGGGLRRGEDPGQAAARELGEEVGLSVDPAALYPAFCFAGRWDGRDGRDSIFELHLASRPVLAPDGREIVATAWLAPAALAAGPVPPGVAAYLGGAPVASPHRIMGATTGALATGDLIED